MNHGGSGGRVRRAIRSWLLGGRGAVAAGRSRRRCRSRTRHCYQACCNGDGLTRAARNHQGKGQRRRTRPLPAQTRLRTRSSPAWSCCPRFSLARHIVPAPSRRSPYLWEPTQEVRGRRAAALEFRPGCASSADRSAGWVAARCDSPRSAVSGRGINAALCFPSRSRRSG